MTGYPVRYGYHFTNRSILPSTTRTVVKATMTQNVKKNLVFFSFFNNVWNPIHSIELSLMVFKNV